MPPQHNLQFLPFVDESVDVLRELADFLGDGQGNLDPAKAQALSTAMHPNDPQARQALEALLANAWTKQKTAMQQAVTVFLGA